jgi:hypothetical protein
MHERLDGLTLRNAFRANLERTKVPAFGLGWARVRRLSTRAGSMGSRQRYANMTTYLEVGRISVGR